ncbi:holo-ACP synthase [Candidatus Methylacidithermus pantelleriae]|uniref:Holo-[acyl-carrier-protein] synthase n=1 Tax=Candidatus Methylacidithermus pantelleriae TaxID=2744239 RepID=A0A8J2BLW2_9BACT|nr:holo-ACP synthase [Candidatus Methylacidithermus pantelleriae]CAF0700611.1 Holo-(acyl-carrier-protein) synthase [Candidatus Methylacidithermus pantelleriae]
MKILGLGIDLVDNGRIDRAWRRFGEDFLRRVFLPSEREYCFRFPDPLPHLAARFAAKEAAGKALGVGVWCWKELEIIPDQGGRPVLRFHGKSSQLAEAKGVTLALVSLTHERHASAACVLLIGKDKAEA